MSTNAPTIALTLLCGLIASPAIAEIVPDSTLPQGSVVSSNNTISAIAGGTQSGTTLFHSFSSFSIPTGQTARFLPNAVVQNIIARVTGRERSQIDGTLAVNGTANLFLLNPNGITFGQNAQLAINGSFVASTAERVQFSDGSEFSATQPQVPDLLTLSVPIGVQFGAETGSIVNQAKLQVLSIALLGGDLILENGTISTVGGRGLFVSAAGPGFVGLDLNATSLQKFGTVDLSGTAAIDTNGGKIQILGGDVTLRDRARITSDTLGAIDGQGIEIQADRLNLQDRFLIRAATTGTGNGGDIKIRANGAIALSGTGYESFERNYLRAAFDRTVSLENLESTILAGTFGAGRAGNLTLDAQELSLKQGSAIGSPTQGSGNGGNLSVRVAGAIEIESSGVGTTATSAGKAGSLFIQTGRLRLSKTGILVTDTLGAGDSGNLVINASDEVVVGGTYPGAVFNSNLATVTAGDGNAGDLEINTQRIRLEQGSAIETASGTVVFGRLFVGSGTSGNLTLNASDEIRIEGLNLDRNAASVIATTTFGQGNAGQLNLNTRRFVSLGQSLLVTSTFGAGQGGTATIRASESVQISGSPINNFGIGTNSGKLAFQSAFGLPSAIGAAGDVRIFTPQLSIQDRGEVSVGSSGSANAGSIFVNADTIKLDNGRINAETNSGGRGNIELRSQSILLRNGSRITTDAGNSNGGNIQIKTGVLAAISQENNDITANATLGRGGNIAITAEGILGLQQRSQLTSNSDITATGWINGMITLRTFNPEPKDIAKLSSSFVQLDSQIAPSCAAIARQNSFVQVGRGGLEPNVSEVVQASLVWSDPRQQVTPNTASHSANVPLVKAIGWVIQSDGTVVLVSDQQIVDRAGSCNLQERAAQ
jgi:filamentous hemagglutinin family protein